MYAFDAGKLGEYLCAAGLMRMGVSCEIVTLDTIDIIANVDRQLVRVQVKSSSLRSYKNVKKKEYFGYQFSTSFGSLRKTLTKEHCDVLAFVAIDNGKIYFEPIENIKRQKAKRFPPPVFEEPDLEKRTWSECMKRLNLTPPA